MEAGAATAGSELWRELAIRRERLGSVHQEFTVTERQHNLQISGVMQKQLILDRSRTLWRERTVSGTGNSIRLFDGTDLFAMDEGGSEYVRTKIKPKETAPEPSPYDARGAVDWSKAVEVRRRPCGLPGNADLCVVLHAPVHPKTLDGGPPRDPSQTWEGNAGALLDLETGLLLSLRVERLFESHRGATQADVEYVLNAMRYEDDSVPDMSLFRLPEESKLREVVQLSHWNAAKIRKLMVGRPAPDLNVTDLDGKPVSLSSLNGRVILLDFWTSWCAPCRADVPALERLAAQYGPDNLAIIGLSVSEDRRTVEEFLAANPHRFPIVLTIDNEMPREYQIAVFPTYVVIDREGRVRTAVEGRQGFEELEHMLRRAGLTDK